MSDKNPKSFHFDISFVRGVAILSIIVCHIGEVFSNVNRTVFYIFTTGQMACQLFFVSSAFALCLSYSAKRQSYGRFLYKRIKKIAPPYWGAIIITALFCIFGPLFNNYMYTSFFEEPFKIVINLLLLHGLIPYGNNDLIYGGWFVGTIVILYLLHPLFYKVYRFVRKYINNFVFILLLFFVQKTIAILFSILNISCPPLSFAYFSVFNQASSFILGMVVYDLYTSNKIGNIKHSTIWFVLSIIGAITVYCIGYFSGWKDTFVFAPLLFGVSYVFLYSSVNRFFSKKNRKGSPTAKIITKLGNRSYGIYLTQLFIIYSFCVPILNHLYFNKKINSVVCLMIVFIIFVPLCCGIGLVYDKLFDRIKSKKSQNTTN